MNLTIPYILASSYSKAGNFMIKLRTGINLPLSKPKWSWREFLKDFKLCMLTESCTVILSHKTSFYAVMATMTVLSLTLDLLKSAIRVNTYLSDAEPQDTWRLKSLTSRILRRNTILFVICSVSEWFSTCWHSESLPFQEKSTMKFCHKIGSATSTLTP